MGFPLPSLLSRDYFLGVYNGYSWSWSKSGGLFFPFSTSVPFLILH